MYDTDWNPNENTWRANMAYTPTWTIEDSLETRNNRLLESREYASLTPDPNALLRTVRYEYIRQTGHAAHITVKDEYRGTGDPSEYAKYRDLWLIYADNGTLWKAVFQNWVPEPGDPWHRGWQYPYTADRVTDCWEFRYDTGRERYLVRQWDVKLGSPNNLNPAAWTPNPALWTDYLGEQPYLDYTTTSAPNLPPAVTEVTRYLAGQGIHAAGNLTGSPAVVNLHGDLVGSTMLATDETGTPVGTIAYSAFGEEVSTAGAAPGRYRYAGAWGYESGLLTLGGANPDLLPITLQHVGWRWYQPGVGRFVQRDPIGLEGGLNPYAYVLNDPTVAVDPTGLQSRPDRGGGGGYDRGPTPPRLHPQRNLPTDDKGWIKIPPGQTPRYKGPVRGWECVPRTPPPPPSSWLTRLLNLLKGVGRKLTPPGLPPFIPYIDTSEYMYPPPGSGPPAV